MKRVKFWLRPTAPHLAILDWDMPIEDGVEVCRWARTMPHLRQLYVIILTAKDGEDDIVQGLSSGANDYVTKPPIVGSYRRESRWRSRGRAPRRARTAYQ